MQCSFISSRCIILKFMCVTHKKKKRRNNLHLKILDKNPKRKFKLQRKVDFVKEKFLNFISS